MPTVSSPSHSPSVWLSPIATYREKPLSDTIFDFSARHGSTIGWRRGRRGVQTVKSVESAAPPEDRAAPNPRQRLVDALAASITDVGYSATTVAEIVRRARTSRRTF